MRPLNGLLFEPLARVVYLLSSAMQIVKNIARRFCRAACHFDHAYSWQVGGGDGVRSWLLRLAGVEPAGCPLPIIGQV
jgi:hypothetical protein